MIFFSPAKINIGLQVIERRDDNYHNLRSVVYPVPLFDIIEMVEAPVTGSGIETGYSGITFDPGKAGDLCIRAHERLSAETFVPPVRIHLHKQIPVGAGLGGGSSNASVTLKALNLLAKPPVNHTKLHEIASELGSDCPFFLHNGPMMVEGRGETLSPISLNIGHLHLVLLNPGIHISTAEAYSGIKPAMPDQHLRDLVNRPVEEWKNLVANDFEPHLFEEYPLIGEIRESLYVQGAVYASMSGSGSSVYGLFPAPPRLPEELSRYVIFSGKPIRPGGGSWEHVHLQ